MHDLECSTLVKGLEFSYSFQKGKLGCNVLNSARDMVFLFAINENAMQVISVFSLIRTRKTSNSGTFHAATIDADFLSARKGDKFKTTSKSHVCVLG